MEKKHSLKGLFALTSSISLVLASCAIAAPKQSKEESKAGGNLSSQPLEPTSSTLPADAWSLTAKDAEEAFTYFGAFVNGVVEETNLKATMKIDGVVMAQDEVDGEKLHSFVGVEGQSEEIFAWIDNETYYVATDDSEGKFYSEVSEMEYAYCLPHRSILLAVMFMSLFIPEEGASGISATATGEGGSIEAQVGEANLTLTIHDEEDGDAIIQVKNVDGKTSNLTLTEVEGETTSIIAVDFTYGEAKVTLPDLADYTFVEDTDPVEEE